MPSKEIWVSDEDVEGLLKIGYQLAVDHVYIEKGIHTKSCKLGNRTLMVAVGQNLTSDQAIEALLKIVCEIKNFAIEDVLPVTPDTLAYAEDAIAKLGWKIELSGRCHESFDRYTIRKSN